jgi:hypothetical protein
MKNKFSTLLPTLKMNFDGPFPLDDPNAPKRPMNAYFLYSNANRARIKAENPDAKFTELPGIFASAFKSLSKEEASKWHKAAAEDKARYQAEMEDYQTNKGGEGKDKK